MTIATPSPINGANDDDHYNINISDDDAVCFQRLQIIEDDSSHPSVCKNKTTFPNENYRGDETHPAADGTTDPGKYVANFDTSSLSTSPILSTMTLICDAWYGFPSQKRPRRERINAVGKQISNFLQWRSRYSQLHPPQQLHNLKQQHQNYQCVQSSTSLCQVDEVNHPRPFARMHRPSCQILFLGAMEDVRAVHRRMEELTSEQLRHINPTTTTKAADTVATTALLDGTCELGGNSNTDAILFQPDVTVEAYLETFMSDSRCRQTILQSQPSDGIDDSDANNNNNNNNNSWVDMSGNNTDTTIIYLSPDASYTLPITSRPPSTIIIGMLVDRQTIFNRSQQRAEKVLNMRAAQLPLKELNVIGLYSNEPLNVDTVMEMMQRWWWNCDVLEMKQERMQSSHNISCDTKKDDEYRKCFLDAAARALVSHRDRHPNRTFHGKCNNS